MKKTNGKNGQTVRNKILKIRAGLQDKFYERSWVIDGALVALFSGEHVLMLGPPGTAKSALASTLCNHVTDATYFSWLLTKFSTPEEIFGPVSLAGLEADKFERQTNGKLPQAHICFVDEIFKANSSILNSLLTVINERIFYNGTKPQTCPLVTMFGASNELPESRDLEALFDRFLLRYWVDYIADRNEMRNMLTDSDTKDFADTLTLKDIERARQEVDQVKFDDVAMDILLDVKQATERIGIRASDRRWKRIIKALKAFAYICSDDTVQEDHFDILPDMLWREPKERPALVQEVGKIANPLAAKATEILDAAKQMHDSIPGSDVGRAKFLAAAAEANAGFEGMKNKLNQLISQNPGKVRRLKESMEAINKMHLETQRQAAIAAGIQL